MGKTLLVAATLGEVAPLLEKIGIDAAPGRVFTPGKSLFDLLVTGVGQMQTAFHLGQILQRERFDLVLNLGIAGSFREEFSRGVVVQVVKEELADLGAEGGLDLFQMKLLGPDTPPFRGGALHARGPELRSISSIPAVSSVTVNRVLHDAESIASIRSRYNPDIVNMEGAAVFYSCGLAGVPALSIRSISDAVGPRDKGTWDIPGAVRVLCQKGAEIAVELGC